jgi:tripartite-type tricarboxylate transporter receptor subunit TctC
MKRLALHFTLAVACAASLQANAQQYPVKPIRIVVGFSPGGPTDVVARLVGQKLTEKWGQQVVVDARPGAGGNIAAEHVAKSPADGYTLLLPAFAHAVNPSLFAKLPFDTTRDFAPVALLSSAANVLAVHPSVQARSLSELIALAKAKPGQLNYGSAGVNGINHLAAELLKRSANIEITLVPYKGVAQALPAVMAGEVQLMFSSLPGAVTQIRNGRIVPIAVTSAKRSNAAPDIPTVGEAGVPGFEASSWFGMLAPAGTPKSVIARLNSEALKVLQSKDIQDSLVRQGMDPTGGTTPAEFDAYLRAEIAKWTRVAREANIKAD